MEARVPSWRPVLPGYKSARKNTRQPRLEVLASGWRPGTKLKASATRLQEAQKAQEAQDSKLGANLVGGGQSSG